MGRARAAGGADGREAVSEPQLQASATGRLDACGRIQDGSVGKVYKTRGVSEKRASSQHACDANGEARLLLARRFTKEVT